MFDQRSVTAIIPARDEESSIGVVLRELASLVDANGVRIVDRAIVCNNGSVDRTAEIAAQNSAIVVFEERPSYSLACHAALHRYFESDYDETEILVFVDADQSVRIADLPALLAPFSAGADIVIGSRVGAQSETRALYLQQRWGNRLATSLIKLFWHVDVSDLGPFRAITAGALRQIDMQDQTFGWTTEMQIRAIQEKLHMVEVSVSALERVGQSKISGTLGGNIRAGRAILGTIFRLWWQERRQP